MIPTPFGAKIEIYGAGSIRATLEIERVNQARKEKEKEDEKEYIEQSILNEIKAVVEGYVIPQDKVQTLTNNPGSTLGYNLEVSSSGATFSSLAKVTGDPAEGGGIAQIMMAFYPEIVCSYTNSSGTFRIVYDTVFVEFNPDGTCNSAVQLAELSKAQFIEMP